MAENWVLKGSLKGPQGDPGQDAQLPAGGTEGQVLTKTADGEAWQDAPEPDLTGMATFEEINEVDTLAKVGADGQKEFVSQLFVVPSDASNEDLPTNYAIIGVDPEGSATIGVFGDNPKFVFGTHYVTSITDAISSTDYDRSKELVTGKAVADYVAENAGSGLPEGGAVGDVLTKTSSGEQWSSGNVFVDEETGYLKKYRDGELVNVNHAVIHSNDMNRYIDVNSADPSILVYGTGMESTSQRIRVESMDGFYAEMRARADEYAEIATNGRLTIGDKTITSITDAISDSPKGNALATDKAVKDYVTSLIATDEEFDSYMGLS